MLIIYASWKRLRRIRMVIRIPLADCRFANESWHRPIIQYCLMMASFSYRKSSIPILFIIVSMLQSTSSGDTWGDSKTRRKRTSTYASYGKWSGSFNYLKYSELGAPSRCPVHLPCFFPSAKPKSPSYHTLVLISRQSYSIPELVSQLKDPLVPYTVNRPDSNSLGHRFYFLLPSSYNSNLVPRPQRKGGTWTHFPCWSWAPGAPGSSLLVICK